MSDEEFLEERNQVDEAFGELLVNLIRQNPCLYDKTCKEYKDKHFVADTWASIAATCNMSVDILQKQWKILRGQFTREHRAQKIYEPSGTGNNTSRRPRKTWYLYESLLFLAPYVAHRKTCSNFVRKKIVPVTESSPQSTLSTLDFVLESPSQSPLQSASESAFVTLPSTSLPESSFINVQSPNIYSDNLSPSVLPLERSASSASSISSVDQSRPLTIGKRKLLTPPADKFAVQKMKNSHKEQEHLTKMIGDTTEAIKITMNHLSEKYSRPINNNNEEEEGMAKALICGLRRVNLMYKIKCYMECLSVLDKYQKLTAEEIAKSK